MGSSPPCSCEPSSGGSVLSAQTWHCLPNTSYRRKAKHGNHVRDSALCIESEKKVITRKYVRRLQESNIPARIPGEVLPPVVSEEVAGEPERTETDFPSLRFCCLGCAPACAFLPHAGGLTCLSMQPVPVDAA